MSERQRDFFYGALVGSLISYLIAGVAFMLFTVGVGV